MLPVQTERRMKTHRIRPAVAADAPAVAAIYAWYVEHSAATFDEVAPTVEENAERIRSARLPFLVAESADGAVDGYAYLTPYRPRSAYRYTAENSVYVADGVRGGGIGRALLSQLLAAG